MTAKQLLLPYKKDVFSNWRKICARQYKKYIWPQIIYTGSTKTDDVKVIGVVFEITASNNEVIHWDTANSYLKINSIPIFYIDSRPTQALLYIKKPDPVIINGLLPKDWPEAFNTSFNRKDQYDSFDVQSIDSYESFRRAANPRGTRACDLDSIEVLSSGVVGIEATEIWKVAPWSYFYKQFENVLKKRQGSYNLDAMMAQWIFVDQCITTTPKKFIFVLHKLLWTDFVFDGKHTVRPNSTNGDYSSGYYKNTNGSAVIDDESVCVYCELNFDLISRFDRIQNEDGNAHLLLSNHLIRKSIYDIYQELIKQ